MEKVRNELFYHIHDENYGSNDLWWEGNEFIIDNHYDSCFGKALKNVNLEEAKLFGDSVCKREIALEELRLVYYPQEISRYHCIWLCNDQSIDYWTKIIQGEIYQVRVNGKAFRSSENFLYTLDRDYKEVRYRNSEYWKGNFIVEEDYQKTEFLFQGKVKVLRRMENR